MNWAEVINETLRYLEKNIMTVQGPKEVAMEVHVSSSYLQNSFQMITGYTIGEYIRRRRLYLAAMDLIEKDEKVIDLASKYGYETPESFTKAFSRFHNATPNEIRKKNKPAKVFLPLKLTFSVKGADTVDVEIEKMPKFKLLGAADVFDNDTCFDKIPGFVYDFINTYGERLNANTFWGVSVGDCDSVLNAEGKPWSKEHEGITFDERFLYLAGVSYDGGEVPEGLTVIEIPETIWVKFKCRDNSAEASQEMRRYIFGEWIFEADEYDLVDEYNVERYGVPNDIGDGLHNEIWIPVRRSS
jgi:AraC family transcriptional regulator